jgi:hypothetical protein
VTETTYRKDFELKCIAGSSHNDEALADFGITKKNNLKLVRGLKNHSQASMADS